MQGGSSTAAVNLMANCWIVCSTCACSPLSRVAYKTPLCPPKVQAKLDLLAGTLCKERPDEFV